MRSAILSASLFVLTLTGAFAADSAALSKTLDGALRGAEKDVVPLVEAMPADKFNFAPSKGEFKGVRTFAQQASHIATVIYMVCAPIMGEKMPVDAGKG